MSFHFRIQAVLSLIKLLKEPSVVVDPRPLTDPAKSIKILHLFDRIYLPNFVSVPRRYSKLTSVWNSCRHFLALSDDNDALIKNVQFEIIIHHQF